MSEIDNDTIEIDTSTTDEIEEHSANSVSEEDRKILALARKRFQFAADSEVDVRAASLDDLEFSVGKQWPEQIKAERDSDGRPSLVINKMPQFIHQVTNEQRQNRPSIKISPVDDQSDVEVAKILEGLIRNIQNTSNADVAYDSAFDAAVRMGRGFFRVCTDYVDEMSFDQEIKIQQVPNHFAVYLDPSSNEPDGSDANWGFVFDEVDKDEYMIQYPDSALTQMASWTSIGDDYLDWIDKNTCRLAEYYCRDFKTIEIFNTPDGVMKEDQLDEETKAFLRKEGRSRFTQVKTINYYKINGMEILERSEFAAPYIPICPVYGDRVNVNGIWTYESLVRHAKDPQRAYNYWVSAETEAIALAPKAPFIVAEGQIPRVYEQQWKNANRKPNAFLVYKPVDFMGNALPPPQRNSYEPPIAAITNARAGASEDIKATTGIYDASLGSRSNETSGRAINARNQQTQTSNFHFVDNLARSLRYAGRIMVALIPKIYDAPRAERILGENGEEEIVVLNDYFQKGQQRMIYDLSVGKYDVVVETGPSFATKRQEAVADLLELAKILGPDMASKISDLLVSNMDSPISKELTERLRKFLPAGIIENKDQAPIPPEVQAQLAQQQQMIEQLTVAANDAFEKIKTKKLELDSKERIAYAQMQNDTELKMADLDSKEAMNVLDASLVQDQARFNSVKKVGDSGALGAGNQQPQM